MRPLSCTPLAVALTAALACSAASASTTGSAEHPPEASTLDTIEVTTPRLDRLDRKASGTTRLDLKLIDTPASVTVIDREQLDARGARDTGEALAGIPGLVVASPPGNGNTVSWRGFSGAQISQLFNGIDVKYASIAARPVDAWMYQRVEAIGGPASFLHGAGAVGGAINYVTRVADFTQDDAGGVIGIGSQSTLIMAGGFNHRFGGSTAAHALRLDAGRSEHHGAADNERREAWTMAASLASRVGETFTHTLALEYQNEDDRRIYWGTPAVVRDNGHVDILPGTAHRNYNAGDGFYGQEVIWGRSVSTLSLGDRGRVRNTLYYYDALRDYRNIESYRYTPSGDAVIRSGALQQRHDQQVHGNRLDWSLDTRMAGRPSQWTAGLELSYNRQTRSPQSIAGDIDTVPIDAATPGSFFDIPGTVRGHQPGVTNRIRTMAVSAENMTWLTPHLGLMSGLRHERIELAVQNHRTPTPDSPARWKTDYAPTTGRIGLNWKPQAGTSIYVQYSTAADPPAGILSTAGFSVLRDFDLSRGHQFEVGAKTRFANGRGSATVAAYRIVRRDLAIADPDTPGQTLPVGRQSSRGIEASFEYHPTAALRIAANLGWVDASLDDFIENVDGIPTSRAGNSPANTPARVANLWIDRVLSQRWSAGLELQAAASRYIDTANTISAAGYGIWGAHVRWTPSDQLTVTARGRNLSDRQYVRYANRASMVYLGLPRELELELRMDY